MTNLGTGDEAGSAARGCVLPNSPACTAKPRLQPAVVGSRPGRQHWRAARPTSYRFFSRPGWSHWLAAVPSGARHSPGTYQLALHPCRVPHGRAVVGVCAA